ncbi:MAG: thiol:disulfide interchange protein DsbA/DsbL [Pseudomonadales bacterium]|nr:thiol:disulfide interchange protein DsbA/DsbL [Pseudomonadales bacterium]
MKLIANAFLSLMLVLTTVAAQAETFREGVDYRLLGTPVDVDNPNNIEVREFFWFGCPHCFALEASLDEWKKNIPEGVDFIATPAPLNKSWTPHAHAFYVAKALGKSSEINAALFDAIHVDKKRVASQDELAKFFSQHGVGEEDFNKLYNSFSVRVAVRKAEALAKAYRLTGVPAIIVNGKYIVENRLAKTNERMMKIVNFLIDKEKIQKQTSNLKL